MDDNFPSRSELGYIPESDRALWNGSSWSFRVIDHRQGRGPVEEKGYIDHPGSVLIVPLLSGQVLMLRQYRLALSMPILELPAGTREKDEDWLTCARRELREETGYRAENWTDLGYVWPAPGLSNELMALYLATELEPAPLPADTDEHIEVQPMSLDRLVKQALDGRLQDAKSVVGILRTAAYLELWY